MNGEDSDIDVTTATNSQPTAVCCIIAMMGIDSQINIEVG